MQAMVRDDIISLNTFVAARFKYEKYMDMLNQCGGYCFIDQFVHHFGKNKGRYLAKQLQDDGIIGIKSFNNYKYCYLTDAALKYLKYKDDPKDFSKVKKANIPIKKLTPYPTDKVLFTSAMKFGLIHKLPDIGKETYIKYITEGWSELLTINHINEDVKKKIIKKAVDKSISYYDKSKIIFTFRDGFRMMIFDTGTKKSAKSYIIILRDYFNYVNVAINTTKIEIYSFSPTNAEKLRGEFEKIKKERDKKESEIKYRYPINPRVREKPKYMNPIEQLRYDEAVSAERQKINSNKDLLEKEMKKLRESTPDFKVSIMNDLYYMEHYKDRIGGIANYIKPKDAKRFENLKESFNR